MKIKNVIKLIGIISLIVGFYNTSLSILAIFYRLFPYFFRGLGLSSYKTFDVGFLFISQFIFCLLLALSGLALLKLKRYGVWLLYLAALIFVSEGVVTGIYQETFFMLVGPQYTWIGKALTLLYLYYTKFLVPTFVLIFFQHPRVNQVFEPHPIQKP